jgi:hypothetical protein
MSTLSRVLAVLGTVATAAVLVAFAQPELGKPGPGHGALVELSGRESKIIKQEFARVTSHEEWSRLWRRHVGAGENDMEAAIGLPKIDFDRCMVVAFFRGQSMNTNGEGLSEAEEVDGTLRLRFDSYGFQTASFNGEDQGVKGHSYGFWVLPKSKKPVLIEENVQDLIGKPPIWKEKTRLDALK